MTVLNYYYKFMKNKKIITSTLAALCLSSSFIAPVYATEIENTDATPNTENVSVLEEGLKNGLVNGTVDGLKDGIKNGLVNGTTEGLKNGTKNGLINGGVNGLKGDLVDGLKNGELKSV